MKNIEWGKRVLESTLFRLEETMTPDCYQGFLVWLNRYDDPFGKHLIDHVNDLIELGGPESEDLLEETMKKITERKAEFYKAVGVNQNHDYLEAYRLRKEYDDSGLRQPESNADGLTGGGLGVDCGRGDEDDSDYIADARGNNDAEIAGDIPREDPPERPLSVNIARPQGFGAPAGALSF